MRFKNVLAIFACVALFGSAARAEVIYSGIRNIPITQDGIGTSLNLITGQVFEGPLSFNDDWDINLFFVPFINSIHPWGLSINKQDPILGNDFGAALAGHYVGSLNIPATRIYGYGFPIGPGSEFLDNLEFNTNAAFTAPTAPANGSAILGLRLFSMDDLDFHYAWVRLALDDVDQGFAHGKIVDYAYESDANVALLSGLPLPVPEPSTFGLMALAACALPYVARGRGTRIA